jgi:hypothetical protein
MRSISALRMIVRAITTGSNGPDRMSEMYQSLSDFAVSSAGNDR